MKFIKPTDLWKKNNNKLNLKKSNLCLNPTIQSTQAHTQNNNNKNTDPMSLVFSHCISLPHHLLFSPKSIFTSSSTLTAQLTESHTFSFHSGSQGTDYSIPGCLRREQVVSRWEDRACSLWTIYVSWL